MKTLTDTGKYKAPNGEIVQFEYSFKAYESVQDAIANEGEADILATINRMTKVDARNNESVKAQSRNGHSKHVAMTPEQKLASKAKRAELTGYAKMVQDLKEGKISLDDLASTLNIN